LNFDDRRWILDIWNPSISVRVVLQLIPNLELFSLLKKTLPFNSFLNRCSMLVPNKMQHVICTGNIGREQFNELCTLAPNVHVVQGDFDDDETLPFPEVQVVQVGQFRIGLIHGHQLLPSPSSQDAKARMRRKLNVDIFISGHTHQNEVVLEDGYYHINPVSSF
jgi:putative phosphoesterase